MSAAREMLEQQRQRNQRAEVLARDRSFTQVCVPAEWTEEEVRAFAKTHNWRELGWFVRKHERKPCTMIAGHVHMMLEP